MSSCGQRRLRSDFEDESSFGAHVKGHDFSLCGSDINCSSLTLNLSIFKALSKIAADDILFCFIFERK